MRPRHQKQGHHQKQAQQKKHVLVSQKHLLLDQKAPANLCVLLRRSKPFRRKRRRSGLLQTEIALHQSDKTIEAEMPHHQGDKKIEAEMPFHQGDKTMEAEMTEITLHQGEAKLPLHQAGSPIEAEIPFHTGDKTIEAEIPDHEGDTTIEAEMPLHQNDKTIEAEITEITLRQGETEMPLHQAGKQIKTEMALHQGDKTIETEMPLHQGEQDDPVVLEVIAKSDNTIKAQTNRLGNAQESGSINIKTTIPDQVPSGVFMWTHLRWLASGILGQGREVEEIIAVRERGKSEKKRKEMIC